MNNVTLRGNIASSIEIKQVGQYTMGRVLLAVNRPGKDNGADFMRVTMWGKTAQNVGRYLEKGSPILVEGRIRGEFWEKDGKKNLSMEVVADRVEFLAGRPSGTKSGKAA